MDENGSNNETMLRRGFLKLAGGAAAVSALGGWTACAPSEARVEVVEVPLDSLPAGGRLRVLQGENPIEIRDTEDGVFARSLWCTHSGCEVKWIDEEEIYSCPCHDGEYYASGMPKEGPPPRPLRDVPLVITDTSIVIGS